MRPLQILHPLLVVALGSLAVCENIDSLASPPALPPASKPYTLNLSCAQCAFTYGDCVNSVQLPSFLTITFSTQNDTLLANDKIIFPTPFPMEFNAKRTTDSNIEDSVPVAYALDAQPLPHQPDAELNDLYRLKLTFVDLQGRTATESPVSLGLVRDADGNLKIISVEEGRPHRRFHHHHHHGENSGGGSWWHLKTWKAAYLRYLHRMTHSRHCRDGSVRVGPAKDGVESRCHRHQRVSDWAGDRHYMRHLRPVLLPALMGMVAGIIACIAGFILGKVMVATFYCFRGRRAAGAGRRCPDICIEVDEDQED
ncbi:hypothetical protein ASPSYDRAFT_406754 [Aspergillus sydowii CBS 593.65]|uniref:Uncharacterized protein n=1 Tax=Aspergillus sydowii CBS 593.65 TaxID=1036612 RepID=A0A1L9T9X2_9EURO|nr:uncharacterized protein ASPSYDRAFT_406754 [Aspergillus sydowii CBS 593.65]OJJ56191.1 hypothetical protein ASPSYDRAFT_406754 [Aspergillus sydowii CBS 593.65]